MANSHNIKSVSSLDLPNFANSRSYIANSNNSAAPTHLHTQILPLPVQSTTFSYDFNRLPRPFNQNRGSRGRQFRGRGHRSRCVPPRDRDSYIYYCQNCDRGFGNRFGNEFAAEAEHLYKEHIDSHIKCPDCAYIAAAPLVEHHYEAQHRTGLAEKIWGLDAPEEISRWREDRKRNFPTRVKVERRERDQEERQKQRAQRSQTHSTGDSECGRGRGRGRGQWRGRGRGQWRGNGRESGGDGGGRDRGRGRGRGRGGNSWRDGDEADADGARDTQEALVARSSAHGPRIAHAPPAAPPLPSPSVALTDPFALAAPRPARKRRTSELSEGEIVSSDEEPSEAAGNKSLGSTISGVTTANAQIRSSSVALCSLVGEYASDSEPDVDAAVAAAAATSHSTSSAPATGRAAPLSSPKQQTQHSQRPACTRDAELASASPPRDSADESVRGVRGDPGEGRPPRRERRPPQQPPPAHLRWHRLTLLEKLLQPEVLREREMLRQCFRFLVQHLDQRSAPPPPLIKL